MRAGWTGTHVSTVSERYRYVPTVTMVHVGLPGRAESVSPAPSASTSPLATQRLRITIQVVPAGAGAHAGLLGAFAIAGFEDTPGIAYMESPDQGQTTQRSSVVVKVSETFDTLRAEALPRSASRDLIRKVAGEAIEPFTISIRQTALDGLPSRLRRTRWPERETVAGWSQGVPLDYLQGPVPVLGRRLRLAGHPGPAEPDPPVHDHDRRPGHPLPARPLGGPGRDPADHDARLARVVPGIRADPRPRRVQRVPQRGAAAFPPLGRAPIQQHRLLERAGPGGHFAAWEQPALFAREVRAAARAAPAPAGHPRRAASRSGPGGPVLPGQLADHRVERGVHRLEHLVVRDRATEPQRVPAGPADVGHH